MVYVTKESGPYKSDFKSRTYDRSDKRVRVLKVRMGFS